MSSPAAGSGVRSGALALLMLSLGTLVLFSYTLLDLPWQQRLGAWNYPLSFGLLMAMMIPIRRR
jgi:hypothetical protein